VTFQSPVWLWALLVLPLLAWGLVAWRRSTRRAAAEWSDDRVMSVQPSRRTRTLRAAAAIAALLAAGAAVVAMARPSVDATEQQRRSTVMITLDESKSMLATDLQPNRLAAAVDAARRLVADAPEGTAFGLVTFADRASVVLAPTSDRDQIGAALDELGDTREGTALGEAVSVALGALATSGAIADEPPDDPSDSPGRVLVLTDGANSILRATSPAAAAEQASAAGVPVYTILLGDDPGRPDQPLPAETLSSMATSTGGIFAQSTTSADLQAVFADIGSIVTPQPVLRELTVWVAGLALALLALAAALGGLSRPRRRDAPPRAAPAR
jgi:Ca-activated chloride channel homolog